LSGPPSAAAAGTVAEALVSAADAIAAAGGDSPRLDAELLLASALACDRTALAADPGGPVPAPAARVFGAMVRRRVMREPVAYILGRKGFRNLELEVDRRVLIPRPETELLVEIALELEPRSVLDVGTGSGAVALAIADELPEARVAAVDTSAEAIAVAAANTHRLGLAGRVELSVGELPAGGEREFDLVVANLPYVRTDERPSLQPEITEYEPAAALFAGDDGLDAIRGLAAKLTPGPNGAQPALACEAIALEVGAGQAPEVAQLLEAAGFGSVECRRDLAGIERCVLARR
jgi:release factor glutamine methyltransferase